MCKYVRFNANEKNRVTDDSLIRALSVVLNKTYTDIYSSLSQFAQNECLATSDKRLIKSFMQYLGYRRYTLNHKCTVEEFATREAKQYYNYVLQVGNKVTAMKSGVLYDLNDYRNKIVTNYWVV